MQKYKVLIFPSAQRDLSEIRKNYRTVLKTQSNTLFEKFLEQIKLLKEYPTLYPIHSDPFLKLIKYRVFVIDNYLVFYVIKQKDVQIHRVIYAKRIYVDLLMTK